MESARARKGRYEDMYFTLNASKDFLGNGGCYRLKKTCNWDFQDKYSDYDFENDMLFNNIHYAHAWLNNHTKVIINGELVEVCPEFYNLADDIYEIEIVCHRTERPQHLFTYDEILCEIKKAKDICDNSPQITFDGYFKIIPLKGVSPISLYDYAVRSETFCAGNGYVGNIDNENFYKELYHSMLDGWLMHLLTGKSQYYGEEYPELSIEEILLHIKNIYEQY